ncbi:hypothetical protein D7V94_04110 [Parablautia intestinalis]|uniref:Uncharacterized protein n=1 Tax=Parablautia intestinalis TaxID=2320100 RepID=A0A3A9AP51_9FIRM|nr:hypothetical protein [Parablautia intestinalis]RKI93172.1 hypothetical protein D7V94_04110 [Parablautia intestinalis]
MEKLFVYALLYSEGFDVWASYADTLDMLFIENLENEEYLSLEMMRPKEAVLHSISVMYGSEFDSEYFGKILMKSLQQIYENISIEVFAKKMYSLWKKLPQHICKEEPFFTLSYADDCLSYGDEYQCRQLYEKAMYYYD